MSIRVEVDGGKSLERAEKLLAGITRGNFTGTRNAAYRALERAGASAKTEAGRFAAEEYTINKGDFTRNVSVTTSVSGGGSTHGGEISMSLKFAGTVLPLLTFNTKYSRDGLLTTQIKRNGGAATLEHAFAERVFGPIAAFERVGSPRFPVEQKFGPSTAHMMQNEQVIEKMDKKIKEEFEKRMEVQITRIMNGW